MYKQFHVTCLLKSTDQSHPVTISGPKCPATAQQILQSSTTGAAPAVSPRWQTRNYRFFEMSDVYTSLVKPSDESHCLIYVSFLLRLLKLLKSNIKSTSKKGKRWNKTLGMNTCGPCRVPARKLRLALASPVAWCMGLRQNHIKQQKLPTAGVVFIFGLVLLCFLFGYLAFLVASLNVFLSICSSEPIARVPKCKVSDQSLANCWQVK